MPDFPFIQKVFIWAVPVIFAITVHEVAHGWVASKLGDQTAKMLGRLTLNPVKHIDPIGTVLVPIILLYVGNFIFGWAKPVPVDWRNLRQPRRDMAIVAVAGPFTNLLMLVGWVLLAKLVFETGAHYGSVAAQLFAMCQAGIMINALLMLLNMLPIPPLDGSRVVSAVLPPALAYRYNQLERFGLIILVILLATQILGRILGPPLYALLGLVDSFLLL
jgi:Zn-dependent protease